MKLFQNRNKSWSEKPLDLPSSNSNSSNNTQQQIPIKYYIAEQMLKDALRKQEYVIQELSQMHEQNLLLEKIKQSINRPKSKTSQFLDESFNFENQDSMRDTVKISRKRSFMVQQLNTTIPRRWKSRKMIDDNVLPRIKAQLGKQEHDYVLGLITENKELKQQINNEEKFKFMFQAERKCNEVLRLQIAKYQNKISNMDKQINMINQKLKSMNEQKQNYSKSMKKIQYQLKVNTTDSTNLMIEQKIMQNEKKKLDLEKHMLAKLKNELDDQLYQVEAAWEKYLPEDVVKEGRQNIRKCQQLLEQQIIKIKELNEEIVSFNSKMCIM